MWWKAQLQGIVNEKQLLLYTVYELQSVEMEQRYLTVQFNLNHRVLCKFEKGKLLLITNHILLIKSNMRLYLASTTNTKGCVSQWRHYGLADTVRGHKSLPRSCFRGSGRSLMYIIKFIKNLYSIVINYIFRNIKCVKARIWCVCVVEHPSMTTVFSFKRT